MFSFLKKDSKKTKEGDQKNWYADRYQNAIVQRNFLALIVVVSLVGILISVLTVIKISSSQKIEPFIIEVEEKTGITTVVRPFLQEQFSYDEALKRYFLTKYINSRETYSYHGYKNSYYKVVRLLSSPAVYSNFRRLININTDGSPLRLADKGTREISIKSIAFLKPLTAQVRFKRYDLYGSTIKNEQHLMATIAFEYKDMNLTSDERAVNPLGFQVIEYSVVEDAVK